MKSMTSPTPPSVMNRVMSTAVSGKYSCFETNVSSAGATRKRPPLCASSSAPNTLGESNRGTQDQSTDPSDGHQSGGLQVPDQPVLRDRWVVVGHVRSLRRSRALTWRFVALPHHCGTSGHGARRPARMRTCCVRANLHEVL